MKLVTNKFKLEGLHYREIKFCRIVAGTATTLLKICLAFAEPLQAKAAVVPYLPLGRGSDKSSGGQEIPSMLWNATVHYRVHKSTLLVPFLSRMNPVHFQVRMSVPNKLSSA